MPRINEGYGRPTNIGGGGAPLSSRVNKRGNGFNPFARLWKSLRSLRAKSEPKPKIQDGFLEQTSRRGAKYSARGALRALVQMKKDGTPIDDCSTLTKGQKALLLRNLKRHAEVPWAIKSAITAIEYSSRSPETKEAFLECLSALYKNLCSTYENVGGALNDEDAIDYKKSNQLKKALFNAWAAGGTESPEDKILEALKMPLDKPESIAIHRSMEMPQSMEIPRSVDMPEAPVRVYDIGMIDKLRAQIDQEGTIDRQDAEGLIKKFMQEASFDMSFLGEFVDNFMGAATITRQLLLVSIPKVFENSPVRARIWAEDALGYLKDPEAPKTARWMTFIETSSLAKCTVHDIALRHHDAENFRDAVKQELRNDRITREQAQNFLGILSSETFPAGSNSGIVYEVIKQVAEGT